MKSINPKDYERLVKLISLDARVILNNRELRKEYEDLHLLIEGFKPSCTGCSARSKLEQWKNKYKSIEQVKVKPQIKKSKMNTFKLKRNYPRVVIPFSTTVITKDSKDSVVLMFLNQADTEEERARRESFFEKLPNSIENVELKIENEEGKVEEIKEVKPKAKKRTKK